MGFNPLDILKKVAPAIAGAAASATGIPGLGAAAAAAVSAALGGKKVGANQDEIAAAVAGATPEELVELKKADQDFQVKMQQVGIDLLALDNADRDSARRREEAVKDKTPTVLAYFYTSIFAGYVFVASFTRFGSLLPIEFRNLVIGYLFGLANAVALYYFGSSAGSAAKSKTIETLTKNGNGNGNGVH